MTATVTSTAIVRAMRRLPPPRRAWAEILVNALGSILFLAGLVCFYFAALFASEAIDAWKGVAQ
jgi:hypothetical protein